MTTVALGPWLGVRVIEGSVALQWTRFHALRGVAGEKPEASAREAAQHAAVALERLAPLPAGAEAARLALALGRELEVSNREAALGLYSEVASAIEAVRGWPLRGLGLTGLESKARILESRARASMPAGEEE